MEGIIGYQGSTTWAMKNAKVHSVHRKRSICDCGILGGDWLFPPLMHPTLPLPNSAHSRSWGCSPKSHSLWALGGSSQTKTLMAVRLWRKVSVNWNLLGASAVVPRQSTSCSGLKAAASAWTPSPALWPARMRCELVLPGEMM